MSYLENDPSDPSIMTSISFMMRYLLLKATVSTKVNPKDLSGLV